MSDPGSGPPSRPPVTLEEARERTIHDLTRHFSRDHLGVEELERRLDQAIAAPDRGALAALVRDLPALPPEEPGAAVGSAARAGTAPAPAPGARLSPGVTPDPSGFVLALLGGSTRRGAWIPPRELRVLAVMGGAELDFREARFGAPVTEVEVLAFMGGVEILVPPGIHVEARGLGIMGGFDNAPGRAAAYPDAPVLRIKGLALMGGVHIEQRLPGETKSDARRRRRRERRSRREP